MDFFGGQATVKAPVVSRVITKKVVSVARPQTTGPSHSHSTTPGSSASQKRLTPFSSSTASRTDTPTKRAPLPSRPHLPSSKSHLSAISSRASTPSSRRKRTPSPVRSESSASSSSAEQPKQAIVAKKRKRPDPSASSTPVNGTPKPSNGVEKVERELWCLDKVDERGEWERGWAGFVGCEEAVRGDVKGWRGGKGEGKGELDKYMAYFPQDGFGVQEPLPSVDVLYPAIGCKEKFILLVPTSPREFNPISELRNVLRTILDHYIPPSHYHIFGTLSESLDLDPTPLPSHVSSPIPLSTSLATPPPEGTPPKVERDSIGDAIRKALAPNRRDGPGLLRAIERYNIAMADLQRSREMALWLKEKGGRLGEGEWSRIVEVVHDQAYSRVVGPYSNELEHHPKHPDEVAKAISGKEDAYGELRHKFMSHIISLTNLTPSCTFVDLGSGVSNCVLQAALQAGCKSFGVELLPVPAHCARLQVAEVKRRWAMWGLNGSLGVGVAEGDFRGGKVGGWLAKADVVLVNNEVFPPALNDDLKNMFLDLKDGARIVSLKPFVNEGFRMNESNVRVLCDSFDAIVRLSQHIYYNDWVSWKGDSGKFYVQVIDRSMRRKFEEELMRGGGRGSRRR